MLCDKTKFAGLNQDLVQPGRSRPDSAHFAHDCERCWALTPRHVRKSTASPADASCRSVPLSCLKSHEKLWGLQVCPTPPENGHLLWAVIKPHQPRRDSSRRLRRGDLANVNSTLTLFRISRTRWHTQT